MNQLLRQGLAMLLVELLVFLPVNASARQGQHAPEAAAEPGSLRTMVDKSYLDLFKLAPEMKYNAADFASQRKALEQGRKSCIARFKGHANQYARQLADAQNNLKKTGAKLTDAQRKQIHCNIQNLDLLKSEADVLAGHAIPTAYDNLNAKLDLIQNWPATYRQSQQEIASGAYAKRTYGDVKDIGFRDIAPGQLDDIKRGQQAVEELRRTGLLPPALENKAIQDYVNSVAQRVARNSDLKVPLHVQVLQSREINAFALPGGYIFIERGLLEEADDESELAGVIAHEIGHVTARHGNKLMKRATIASLFYQAAQIAATVLTGGAAGIGMYYALQYGFYGLGLVINLNLLGVSRGYELEADRLGIQYAWKAGYDTSGFIRFFDKMATRAGYVNGVSWFRTHPPFYQRMVDSEREIMSLAPGEKAVVQTLAFEQMKKELAPVTLAAAKEEVGKPSLKIAREEGCEPPKKLEYKPGQPIEDLCALPVRMVGGSDR